MKLPNGYGSVVKLSGKRRKPWMVRKTTGYRIDPVKEKKVNEYMRKEFSHIEENQNPVQPVI